MLDYQVLVEGVIGTSSLPPVSDCCNISFSKESGGTSYGVERNKEMAYG